MCAVCYAVVAVLVLANTQADLCSWYGKGCSGTTMYVYPSLMTLRSAINRGSQRCFTFE